VTSKVVFVTGALHPSIHRLTGICRMKSSGDHFDPSRSCAKKTRLAKQNQPLHASLRSTPTLTLSALLFPSRSALMSGVLTHREAPTPTDPAASPPPRRDPWSRSKIHSPPARSTEVVRPCCRGLGGSPPPGHGALPTPGGALSHPNDRAPPTPVVMVLLAHHPLPLPPSQVRHWWQWCSCAAARRRLRARRLESTGPGFSSPMLKIYVLGVSIVSKVCCSCFLWMLQK
jgi:hypothetical protein